MKTESRRAWSLEPLGDALAQRDAERRVYEAAWVLAVAEGVETAAGHKASPLHGALSSRAFASTAAVSTSLQTCGPPDLPPCYVKARESGGSYTAYNPNGCGGRSCGGAWQFDPRTWNNYGGYPEAQLAPPAVQDARARELWASGAGCGHWAACS